MSLSRRSLIAGAGAAIITRPALASGPLIARLRAPLAFPGTQPGFDPSHPVAKGIRLSAVAMGSVALMRLDASVKTTVTGSPSFSIGPVGPQVTVPNTTGINNSWAYAGDTVAGCTLGAVITPTVSLSNGQVFNDNGTLGGSTSVGVSLLNLQPAISFHGGTLAYASAALSLNRPYFIGVTAWPTFAYWVTVDLFSGKTLTATTTATYSSATPNSPQFVVFDATGSNPMGGSISAFAYSISPLTIPQINAWARSPWDFWYPQGAAKQIFAALKGVSSAAPTGVQGLFLNGITQ